MANDKFYWSVTFETDRRCGEAHVWAASKEEAEKKARRNWGHWFGEDAKVTVRLEIIHEC